MVDFLSNRQGFEYHMVHIHFYATLVHVTTGINSCRSSLELLVEILVKCKSEVLI